MSTLAFALLPLVMFRVGGTDEAPELRPALVVKPWSDECANLVVFFDGTNDHRRRGIPEGAHEEECHTCTGWRTSVTKGNGIGQWREVRATVEAVPAAPPAPEPAPVVPEKDPEVGTVAADGATKKRPKATSTDAPAATPGE